MDRERGFLLLKPKPGTNSGRIAQLIAQRNGVREVFLTSGDYAFVVSVDTKLGSSIAKIKKSIRKVVRRVEINTAIGHYLYKN